MKLNKHIKRYLDLLVYIVFERDRKRFAKGELVDLINKKIKDSRLNINKQQLAKIVNQQKEFELKKTREHYEFKPK
jgi:hypothetical protein